MKLLFLCVAGCRALTSDEQPTLAPTADASGGATCATEFRASEQEHATAAAALGVSDSSFAMHERQPMWRQAVARTVVPNGGGAVKDVLYWIEPKSAHTTIVGHLMKGAAWDTSASVGEIPKAGEKWDTRHDVATAAEMLRLGAKVDGVAEEIAGSKPFEWTVVREPLSHFMAGFDEVEFFYKSHPDNLTQFRASPQSASSAWLAARDGNATTIARAHAMLADMLAQRGPTDYVQELVHITPQSLGFTRTAASGNDSIGAGFTKLDFVGHMEDMDSAWSHVTGSLNVVDDSETPAHAAIKASMALASEQSVVNVNNQQGRRLASENELKLLFENPTPQAHAEDAKTTQLVTAMCAILKREYACLGYEAPSRCAHAYATTAKLTSSR